MPKRKSAKNNTRKHRKEHQASDIEHKENDTESVLINGMEITRIGRHIVFKNNVAEEEYEEFQKTLRQACNEIPDTIRELVDQIRCILRRYSTFEILTAHFVKECITNGNTYQEWEHPGLAAAFECVALIAKNMDYNEHSFPENVIENDVEEISKLSHQVIQAICQYYAFEKIGEPSDEKGKIIQELRIKSILNTVAMRCHAYEHHLKELLSGIFTPINRDLHQALGFTIDDAIKIDGATKDLFLEKLRKLSLPTSQSGEYEELAQLVNEASIEDYASMKSVMEQILSLSKEEAFGLLDHIQGHTPNYREIGVFTLKEIEEHTKLLPDTISRFMSIFSLPIQNASEPFAIPYITNPFSLTPFLQNNSSYMRVGIDSLASLQPRLEKELNGPFPKLWNKYVKFRSEFVEKKAISLIADVLKSNEKWNSLYYEIQEDGVNKRAELDGLVLYDTHAFLIEVKSGTVNEASRRGSPDKILKDVQSLMSDPHRQTLRAKNFITNHENIAFETSDGQKIQIERERISHIHMICVTLEQIDAFATSLFLTAGLNPQHKSDLPFTISLRDLMVIVDFIDFPSVFVHYIKRRSRLNQLEMTHAMDELDLFGHYLTEGLYFEYYDREQVSRLHLATYSTIFDNWYMFKSGARTVPAEKPSLKLSTWHQQLLSELESNVHLGKSHICLAILEMSTQSKNDLESRFYELVKLNRKDGRSHSITMLFNDGGFGICIYVGKGARKKELYDDLVGYSIWKKEQTNIKEWFGFTSIVGEKNIVDGWVVL